MSSGDPIEVRPKLRNDLELHETTERGQACTYIRDPVTRTFVRLGSTAREAIRYMNGARNLDELAGELSEGLGVRVSETEMRGLCQKLDAAGLLEGSRIPPHRRVRGNALYLVIPMFDPDRLMDRLAPLWRIVVSLPMAIFMAGLVLAGVVVTAVAHVRGVELVPSHLGFFDIVVFYAAASLAIAGHELAHAATLKRFGGRVHEMGVLLLYFCPCFFCNVSDAYMIDRTKRLWVSFAGIFFELALWGAATVAVFALGVDTEAGRVAGVFMTVVGLRSVLLNLNPLIKLDGYYLLVDLLELPNLQQRAFGLLTHRVRQWFGREGSSWQRRDSRETPILLVYAVAALVFLVFVFVTLVTKLAQIWRDPKLSLTGVVLALFAAVLFFRGVRFLASLMRGSERGE